MTGILLLAHGSRRGGTAATLRQIAAYVKEELGGDLVEEALLYAGGGRLEDGLLRLMGRGADDIKVIPYFLFDGIHVRETIPAALAAFHARHPHIKITLGEILGPDQRLAEIVADQARRMTS